jgi:hypothetical protein
MNSKSHQKTEIAPQNYVESSVANYFDFPGTFMKIKYD